jgi:hypothetical protein
MLPFAKSRKISWPGERVAVAGASRDTKRRRGGGDDADRRRHRHRRLRGGRSAAGVAPQRHGAWRYVRGGRPYGRTVIPGVCRACSARRRTRRTGACSRCCGRPGRCFGRSSAPSGTERERDGRDGAVAAAGVVSIGRGARTARGSCAPSGPTGLRASSAPSSSRPGSVMARGNCSAPAVARRRVVLPPPGAAGVPGARDRTSVRRAGH